MIIHTEIQTPLTFMSLVNRGLTDAKTIDVVPLSTNTKLPRARAVRNRNSNLGHLRGPFHC